MDTNGNEIMQLEQQYKDLTERLHQARKAFVSERQAAVDAINEIASRHGLTVTVGGVRKARVAGVPRVKLPALYRDPGNPSNEWSGRGRQPVWLRTYIALGNSIDSCKV